MNVYKEGKNTVDEIFEAYKEGDRSGAGTTIGLLASAVWALLDIAESLDNIRQNGVQVETFASANQSF